MMIGYMCKCGFYFERAGDSDQCPDCGGRNVRFATDDELAEHLHNKEEADRAYSQQQEPASSKP